MTGSHEDPRNYHGHRGPLLIIGGLFSDITLVMSRVLEVIIITGGLALVAVLFTLWAGTAINAQAANAATCITGYVPGGEESGVSGCENDDFDSEAIVSELISETKGDRF